jgi:hypothetical protein
MTTPMSDEQLIAREQELSRKLEDIRQQLRNRVGDEKQNVISQRDFERMTGKEATAFLDAGGKVQG